MKTSVRLIALLGTLLAVPLASAGTLSAVPMQGGMVMPMVSYSATDGRVRVMLDPTVPQLTPLLVSNPSDQFAPEDPWYDALDPRRQGLAFSRRYGFVMATMTDPLPEGTSLWLRKLHGSPELGAYRYANTAPKAFEPIFGTAGSAPAMAWNGMMFHPTFTAPAGTNTYLATFDVFVGHATTGEEVAGSASQEFTLQWTTVPDGRPELAIARQVVIRWPVPASGNFVLEGAADASAANWEIVTAPSFTLEGQHVVLVEPASTTRVYRLRLAP